MQYISFNTKSLEKHSGACAFFHTATKKHRSRGAAPVSGCMKAIKVSEFEIIKCGVEFITCLDARPGVEELLPHMERNENYVYWMLPKGGSTEQQQACICVNGTFYALNNKLEKAIFRNVRLTRDFKNYERMVDGTQKLVIPHRLFQEKLRTSNRVCAVPCFEFPAAWRL
jgi:hypothetical protein